MITDTTKDGLGRIISAALPWRETFSVEWELWLRRTFSRA